MGKNIMLPEDIQREWFSVIRRLQSVSKSQGLSVISISILVDADGTPQAWTAPKQTFIEPKNAASAIIGLFIEMEK
jgi:hypothetical protein